MVTEYRRELFGSIHHGKLCLNEAGCMVKECIDTLPARFHGLVISNSVVMPNHVHILLVNEEGTSVSEIMRQFKAVTSRMYNKGIETSNWPTFDIRLWQRSFYDVIIKNQRMYDFINDYITVNPERWIYDKMNQSHAKNTDEICNDLNKLR